MEESFFAAETSSRERQSLLPGTGFFIPDDLQAAEQESQIRTALAEGDVVVIADPDPDGLAAAALIDAVVGDVALVPTGPHELEEHLSLVVEHLQAERPVFICDLAPDSTPDIVDPLSELASVATKLRWFDHHQWDQAALERIRELGIELTVGDSDEECTADVACRMLDGPIPEHLQTLVSVTRDHDLWIKEDPRSDDLADFAQTCTNPREYLDVVSEHGVSFPDPVTERITEYRETKTDRIDRAVRRASFHEIGAVTVAITYGRCSQNEVAEELRTAGADAVAVVKPAGSVSLRGSEGFAQCHVVARQLNGGGHPQAAGCKPAIYDDMLDYAHHWVTEGAPVRARIREAFDRVITDYDGETDHESE